MKSLRLIIKCLKNNKIRIILYLLFSLIIAYLTTFIPIIIQYFLDVLLNEKTDNNIIEIFVNIFNNTLIILYPLYLLCVSYFY